MLKKLKTARVQSLPRYKLKIEKKCKSYEKLCFFINVVF